ncbi:MAG: PilZ domain-containing protein [Sulfuriferula sp.]
MPTSHSADFTPAQLINDERRQEPRLSVSWRAALMFNTAKGPLRVFGYIKDISVSGLRVECDQTIITTQPVHIIIEIPSKDPQYEADVIQIYAAIRNSILSQDKYRLGLQITDFLGDAKLVLMRRIKARNLQL